MSNIHGITKENLIRSAKIELIKRYAKSGDILAWGKLLFPDKFFREFCHELHDYFISICDKPMTATLAPRGSSKTTVRCFLIPMFFGLNQPDKYKYFLNVQSTATKAIDVNNSIKNEIENNELLHSVYGDLIGEKWTEKLFQLKNGVVFGSVGAGESMRGKNFHNIRPDHIIIDDLYDDEDINNVTRIEKKTRWVWGTLFPARAVGDNTCIHFQGTAIAKYDILHDLSKKDGCEFRKFKAIKDDGTPLYKELYTLKDLEDFKELMGSIIFMREYQNEPRDDENAIIKTTWIQYISDIPENEKIVERLCGVDPSIGEKEISDATGIAVIYKTKDENNVEKYYIVDLYNERISMHERIKLLKNLHEKYNFTRVFVESIAGFKDFTAELRRQSNLPISEIKSVKDKISTLENRSHNFENSKVFIISSLSAKLQNILVEQLTTNHPQHDDLRDAVLLCLKEKGTFFRDWSL